MTRSEIATVVAIGVIWAAKALADGPVASNPPANQRRPQEEAIAAAPLPYREELVTFDNPAAPEVRLAATQTYNLNRRLFDAIAASKDQTQAQARVRKV